MSSQEKPTVLFYDLCERYTLDYDARMDTIVITVPVSDIFYKSDCYFYEMPGMLVIPVYL